MIESQVPLEIPTGFSALLKIQGGEADRQEIRADCLAAVLSGMQKVAYLLAAVESGQELGERLKPSRAMREQFSLRCGVPQMGSYALPLDIGSSDQLDIGLPPLPLLDQMQKIWASLSRQDHNALKYSLPTSIRQKVLREIQKLLPKEHDGLLVGLQTLTSPEPAFLTWRTSRFIGECLAPRVSEDTVMTVTGELQRIDFAARQVTILYPPTRREIVCTYLPDIEDSIIEARKEPIQVTGRFVLDNEGNPDKLMDVTRIEPIDLSPWVINELESMPVRLKAPLELIPVLDEESQQYLCVEESSLGLSAFALNREQLFDEIQEQLAMLWKEYACAPDADLGDQARALKIRIRARMEEVCHAKV
ncbi:MAG: hypothetical protein WCP34_12360 [Pseudomonadota bacterium]